MGDPHDVFISYSRSASAQLAADLQAAIERYGKPWNKRRVLRVFRDDSSMSASPALWSSIEDGLTQSDWLILLASNESAASDFVNRDVRWWLNNKDSDHLLLVRTDGEIVWNEDLDDFDHNRSTATQPALQGAFSEEPRWIDFGWYSPGAAQDDPRFQERIADLSAPIRGMDRDELVGQSLREHRRTRRYARGALVTLTTFLGISLIAGFLAIVKGQEALRERDNAEQQSTVATGRQLAASSRW